MSFPNSDDPIRPWDWNLPLELTVWFIVFLLIGGIALWTRSGTFRKYLPDILGRNVEDFAGVTQEGNGPIPLFLLVLYVVVGSFIIGHLTVTLIVGYLY